MNYVHCLFCWVCVLMRDLDEMPVWCDMTARARQAARWCRRRQCSTGGLSAASVLGKCHRMLCQTWISAEGDNVLFWHKLWAFESGQFYFCVTNFSSCTAVSLSQDWCSVEAGGQGSPHNHRGVLHPWWQHAVRNRPLGCWSTAPHAVILTIMREHYYRLYLYMLCRLMYWSVLLIYTKQLPVSELWVHDV